MSEDDKFSNRPNFRTSEPREVPLIHPLDGGPAFPSHGSMGEVAQEGMSLRDYFAAKVLEGEAGCHPGWGVASQIEDRDLDARCRLYYRLADAMLKARKA